MTKPQKRTQIVRTLSDNGCEPLRNVGGHEIWGCPSAYTATATREGRWWVIDVDGVGVTQSRTLAEAHTWAQGLVEAVTGEAGAEVTVTPSLPDGTLDRVRHAQTAMAHADVELRAAADEIREATRSMLEMGMSQQDVAVILGVSRQRVSQLLNA